MTTKEVLRKKMQAISHRDAAWAWYRDAEPLYQELVDKGTTGNPGADEVLRKKALQCVLGELAWRRLEEQGLT